MSRCDLVVVPETYWWLLDTYFKYSDMGKPTLITDLSLHFLAHSPAIGACPGAYPRPLRCNLQHQALAEQLAGGATGLFPFVMPPGPFIGARLMVSNAIAVGLWQDMQAVTQEHAG